MNKKLYKIGRKVMKMLDEKRELKEEGKEGEEITLEGRGFTYVTKSQKKTAKKKGRIKITGPVEDMEEVKSPQQIKGHPVYSVAAEAFSGRNSITSVRFKGGENIRTIERKAFRNCTSLKSAVFSSSVEVIGAEAFEGCSALETAAVPVKVKRISTGTFRGCTSLANVYLPEGLEEIGKEAFAGCTQLAEIVLPESLVKIEAGAFPENTYVKVREGSAAVSEAEKQGYRIKIIPAGGTFEGVCDSACGKEYRQFFSEDALDIMTESFVVRNRKGLKKHENCEYVPAECSFDTDDKGNYLISGKSGEDKARIILTGDITAGPVFTESLLKNGEYDDAGVFDGIRDILRGADLAIGGITGFASDRHAYSHENSLKKHSNAPEAFIKSLREAGIGMVTAGHKRLAAGFGGPECVCRTLDAFNRNHMIHTGVFASAADRRYVTAVVNGIRIAVISAVDREAAYPDLKYWTETGAGVLFNSADEESLRSLVKDAKEKGAEFVIVRICSGNHLSDIVTEAQERAVRAAAEAGADFVAGSGPDVIQPYTVVMTEDGRKVPAVYSAGALLWDREKREENTGDSIIIQLDITRDQQGSVVLQSAGYHPAVTWQKDDGTFEVVSIEEGRKRHDIMKDIALDEAYIRIRQNAGAAGGFVCLEADKDSIYDRTEALRGSEEWMKYEIAPPAVARVYENGDNENRFIFDDEAGIYRQVRDTGLNEAKIICAGQFIYDKEFDEDSCFEGRYEFGAAMKQLNNVFRSRDMVIAAADTMFSDEYPTIMRFTSPEDRPESFANAPVEFAEALARTGVTCLAMADCHNMGTGVRGIFRSDEILRKSNIIPAGIGIRKNPVIDINGVKIGVLSMTDIIYDRRNMITEEGADKLLGEYSPEAAGRAVAEMKEKGADFIIAYFSRSYGKTSTKSEKAEVVESLRETGRKLAEAGADYVVCIRPDTFEEYFRYETSDGRTVPVAASLGTVLSGTLNRRNEYSALLDITVRKDQDGTVVCEDSYIPLQMTSSKEVKKKKRVTAATVTHSVFTEGYVKDLDEVTDKVGAVLGGEISPNRERLITVKKGFEPQITIREIYKLMGAEPSKKDLIKFGPRYDRPVKHISSRKNDLTRGCVAVLAKQYSYQLDKVQMTEEDIRANRCVMCIAKKPVKGVPTIVADSPRDAYKKLIFHISKKHHPLTVAITGTVGKTTTKELTSIVFESHYRTMHIQGNNNSLITAGLVVQKLTDEDEAYIQEVHGGTIGSAASISELIRPDICIITNIGPGHLAQMKTMENVIKGKMDITAGMTENGVLIINNDNEYLREQHPDVKTIRYSSYDENCDYYASDIDDRGDRIFFRINSRGGEFDEPGSYDAVLNFQGIHNVNNAVGVFAACRQAGIPAGKILAGIARYQPSGDRQNLFDNGGYEMLVDVYSCTPLSMISAVETLANLNIKDGGRRIAVTGDIPDQGDSSIPNHIATGEKIAELDFDVLFSVGEDARYMVEKAREAGREAYFFHDRKAFNRFLADYLRTNDVIVFKAGSRVHLKEQTLLPVFGRTGK